MNTEAQVARHPFNLLTISFRHACFELNEDFNPQVPNQKLVGQFRVVNAEHAVSEAETMDANGKSTSTNIHRFVTTFEFKYILGTEVPSKEEGVDDSFAAKMTASIAAEYLQTPEVTVDQAFINSWGGGNVQLHVWPYWREFCQSCMSKMNVPVTTLPLLSVANTPVK